MVTALCALTVYGTVPETRPGPAPGRARQLRPTARTGAEDACSRPSWA
ncbi:hypothetical protein ACFQ3Z_01780 [Streptomyces nogalater]